MLAKRIIPCLDVKDGAVVKGIKFKELRETGDAVDLAREYFEQGADELVFLDITASLEKRKTLIELVKRIAENIFIPFTVGGGIKSIEEIRDLLKAGADKVSINSAALANPKIISEAAARFGSQAVVVAIDAKKSKDFWQVFSFSGTKNTGRNAVEWAKEVECLGAGEILLTSMDRDGTKKGFDLELLKSVSEAVNIPVIASGGAGSLDDLAKALIEGKADAVLAASIFHFNEFSVGDVKDFLKSKGILVRT